MKPKRTINKGREMINLNDMVYDEMRWNAMKYNDINVAMIWNDAKLRGNLKIIQGINLKDIK